MSDKKQEKRQTISIARALPGMAQWKDSAKKLGTWVILFYCVKGTAVTIAMIAAALFAL